MELRELCKLERTMEGIVNSTNTIFLITNLKSIVLSCFSSVWPFASPWTETHQTSLSMGFSRQEYWSGLPFPLLGDLPSLEIKPASLMPPALTGKFFITSTTSKSITWFFIQDLAVLISKSNQKWKNKRNSLVAQWLGFRACTAGGTNLISAQGTETLQALQKGPKKKERKKRMRGKKKHKRGKGRYEKQRSERNGLRH